MKLLFLLYVCAIFLFQISEYMLQKHPYPQKRIIPLKSRYSAVTTTDRQKHLGLYLDEYSCESRENNLRSSMRKLVESKIEKLNQLTMLSPCEELSLKKTKKAITQMRDEMRSSLNSFQFAIVCSNDQQSTLAWFLLPTDILKIIGEYIA